MSRENEVLEVIAKVVQVGRHEIEMDKPLSESLGMDSTEMVELVLALPKKLNLTIEDDVLSHQNTPRQIVATIESLDARASRWTRFSRPSRYSSATISPSSAT